MITREMLEDVREEFKKLEDRSDYFRLARNLILEGKEIEGIVLLLATWNFAYFRYFVKTFDTKVFMSKFKPVKTQLSELNGYEIKTIDLDAHKNKIIEIYGTLSSMEDIGFTGASKLMHLYCPEVFIMWDGYIRGEKLKRYYEALGLKPLYKKYSTSPDDYFRFLKDMKELFGHIEIDDLAKRIDEYNYVNITLPIQAKEKEAANNKKEKMKYGR